MWLLFAVLSLCAFASTDVLAKKNMDSGTAFAPLEMLICVGMLAVPCSVVFFVSGLGESGAAPWQLVMTHPPLLLNLFSFLMYWLLFLLSMRYVGLSVDEAFSGTTGILYFAGLVLLNLCSGQLTTVKEMLHPLRLLPILIVLIFTFLLPRVEIMAIKFSGTVRKKVQKECKKTVTGLLILFFALIFDAIDSLITTFIFDDGKIGLMDYLTAGWFSMIIPLMLFSLILWKKNGKIFIPFRDNKKSTMIYACTTLLSIILYTFASSFDAVRTGIIFTAAPVVPMIGARIFLKEKYTWRQNVCIWTISMAAIAFCIADNIL